jgi:ABC-type transport system involved in cytochrome c biogenesis permease subunit
MSATSTNAPNPLARAALNLPPATGRLLSLGGRLAAGAIATVIAADQSYLRTRWFALVVAVLVLASCLPAPAALARRLPWLGSGLAFFVGALLLRLPAGNALLFSGALAAVGVGVNDAQQGRISGVAWFFAAIGPVIALIVAVVLGVKE